MEKINEFDLNGLIEQGQQWITSQGLELLLGLLGAIAIFYIGRWVANTLTKVLEKILNQRNVDETLVSFALNLARAAMMVFVVLAALGQLGIQTTSFIAVLGAAGLAVGLALQGSLANFAAGVLMIIFRPIRVGDFVEAAGSSGIVEDIQIFVTQMRTPDNKTIIIPNAEITGSSIVNYSIKPTRRIDFVFGVSYDADLRQTRDILEGIIAADERILADPAPVIAVSELADSSVNFVVRPWVKREDYWDVYFEITEKVKLSLDEANIGIPYPQMDVHVHQQGPTSS
ncbi:MAG TPA: mechanosensitive ion channel protein [Gammaproteobacteria bacterium]|nr:mechanosensitive ion channel protein [Gammaproteobacteria bacterium]